MHTIKNCIYLVISAEMCQISAKNRAKGLENVLLEFSCSNFLSIAERQTFSMIPAKGSANVHEVGNRHTPYALRAAAIYGPNGSGKSNIIAAMEFVQYLVKESGRFGSEGRIEVTPFALDEELANAPSEFEIVFSRDGDIWRYGFTVSIEGVHSEWLFLRSAQTSREREIFYRSGDGNRISKSLGAYRQILNSHTTKFQLFLSKLDQFDDEVTHAAFVWIVIWLRPITSISDFPKSVTVEKICNPSREADKASVFAILRAVGILFEDVTVKEFEAPDKLESLAPLVQSDGLLIGNAKDGSRKLYDVSFVRKSREGSLATIPYRDESLGTHTLFGVAGMLVDSLKVGFTLVIDELNQTFHPATLRTIVELFYSDEANPRKGQLIFTTHDVSVMSILERDQIWLVEKEADGASFAFSLADFGSPRRTGAFAKQYLENRYGGLPKTNLVGAISALSRSSQDFA